VCAAFHILQLCEKSHIWLFEISLSAYISTFRIQEIIEAKNSQMLLNSGWSITEKSCFTLLICCSFYETLFKYFFFKLKCHLDERITLVSKSNFPFIFFSRFLTDKLQTALINTQRKPQIHISENTTRQTSFHFASSRHYPALEAHLFSTIHPQPCREPTMSGKERSPRHRPWSVYRANTFDLSAEMMGLALSGS